MKSIFRMRCPEQKGHIATDVVLRAHSQKVWNVRLENGEKEMKEITEEICQWLIPELRDAIQTAVSFMHKVLLFFEK